MNDVLHANWSGGSLHLWMESQQRFAAASEAGKPANGVLPGGPHPFAMAPVLLASWLPKEHADALTATAAEGTLKLRLPCLDGRPLPSSTLARATGRTTLAAAPDDETETPLTPSVETLAVSTLAVPPSAASAVVIALAEALDVEHHSMFQVSTSGALIEGLYQGAMTVGDLRRHGERVR